MKYDVTAVRRSLLADNIGLQHSPNNLLFCLFPIHNSIGLCGN